MEKLNRFISYLAAIILFATVMMVITLVNSFLSNSSIPVKSQKLVIEYKIDSVHNVKYNNLEVRKLDSLMSLITSKHDLIDKKQEILLQSQLNDTFLNKIFTALIAFILALAGFFGFKSINEIKAQSIEDSVKATKEDARLEFNKVFTNEYKSEIFNQSQNATNEFIRTELDQIRTDILTIQAILEANGLGLNGEDDNENNNNQPEENPFN